MLTLDAQLGPLPHVGLRALVCLMVLVASISSRTCGQCNFVGSSVGEPLTYSFEPLVRDGKLVLTVALEFRGGPEGRAELVLLSVANY
jgi:hypothetical protein